MEEEKRTLVSYLELGEFLEVLHCTYKVDGKRLSIRVLSKMAAMSPNTYEKIKGGIV